MRAEKNLILPNTPDQIDKFDKEIQQQRLNVVAKLDHGERIASVQGKPKWAAFRASWQRFVAAEDKLREFVKQGETAKALELSVTEVRQAVAGAQQDVNEIIEIARAGIAHADEAAAAQYESAWMLLMGGIAISALIAACAGVWISLNISRGLRRTIALAEAVAIGDLSQEISVSSNDEISDVVTAVNTNDGQSARDGTGCRRDRRAVT